MQNGLLVSAAIHRKVPKRSLPLGQWRLKSAENVLSEKHCEEMNLQSRARQFHFSFSHTHNSASVRSIQRSSAEYATRAKRVRKNNDSAKSKVLVTFWAKFLVIFFLLMQKISQIIKALMIMESYEIKYQRIKNRRPRYVLQTSLSKPASHGFCSHLSDRRSWLSTSIVKVSNTAADLRIQKPHFQFGSSRYGTFCGVSFD